MPLFVKSMFRWDCDECGLRFTPGRGGVCSSCKRSLCFVHLHGSVTRHVMVYFGAPSLCVQCRSGNPPASVSPE
jgi:hypothetical protein